MSGKKGDKDRYDINLRNLRRMDDTIKEILNTASAVGVYQFAFDQKKWTKLQIEGPLHVVRRSINPKTVMIVTNRLNTNNLVQPVTKDTDVKIQLPFLMFKNMEKGIFCIWFYSEDECQDTGTLLLNELNSLTRNGPGEAVQPPSSPATASLVDTLAQIGIKNITVAKSGAKSQESYANAVSEAKNSSKTSAVTKDSSEPNNVPGVNEERHKMSENGARSITVEDLFAKVTLAQGNAPHTDPRPAPRATSRNHFAPINLIHDLEKAKEAKESVEGTTNESYEEEMLTPAMIKEKSKVKSRDEEKQITLSMSPSDLVPSSGDSYIFGPPGSLSSNLPDNPMGNRSTPVNRSQNKANSLDLQQLPIDQLKKTLIHLIQTDSDFVRKIRAALIAQQQSSFQ